jgi:alkanesulfonate monooxygenase SsuD/methylene tetrahydromethanopterin reductase-like flavin-dependent oxidoreductase (luciferase family)
VVAQNESLSVGTGVVPIGIRTAPLVAMAGATLQAMAPDREVYLGVGISSPFVVARTHGASFPDRPLAQTREYLTLLRACLSGERVDFDGDYYQVKGFRLTVPLGERRPRIVLAALNGGMLRLGGEVADAVLLNYVPAAHVPECVRMVRAGGAASVFCYVHAGVCDRDRYLVESRRHLGRYCLVDGYAKAYTAAGFGDAVRAVRERHAAGDGDAAFDAVPESMVDAIDVMGDADRVRAAVGQYVDAGVDLPVVFPLAWQDDAAAITEATLGAVAPGVTSAPRRSTT